MRTSRGPVGSLLCALVSVSLLAGCSSTSEPVRDAREALGTVVSVTAYRTDGASDEDVLRAVDDAYVRMAGVESALDAHEPGSVIARLNAGVVDELPAEALQVLEARTRLGVEAEFSPHLLEVTRLYGFEEGGTVPEPEDLARALEAHTYDLGGAAKGLALDEAIAVLDDEPDIAATLVSAGSTTVTTGSKPDGEPWRIGVEHPREPSATIATVEAPGPVTVSTSGDYQRYFERDGVRYHHILDPATGLPVRGLRSLTVVGAASGLDSDILSTALFVMGRDRATTYAEERGLGLVLVDDEGRVLIVPGPTDAAWRIVEQ